MENEDLLALLAPELPAWQLEVVRALLERQAELPRPVNLVLADNRHARRRAALEVWTAAKAHPLSLQVLPPEAFRARR